MVESSESPVRVLLVEDDEDDYVLTRDLLHEVDARVFVLEWVADYGAARAAISRREHDVYLLDYRLGEHDGIELLSEVQAKKIDVPIILLTGLGSREIDLQAMRAGAVSYLAKGELDAPLLDRTIRYAIQMKAVEEQLRARTHQQEAVVELGHYALADPDLEKLLRRVVETAAITLSLDQAVVFEIGSDGALLAPRQTWNINGFAAEENLGAHPPTLAGFTLIEGAPVLSPDLQNEERFHSVIGSRLGLASAASVIVRGRDAPFGTLAVYGRERRIFTRDEVTFLQAVAAVLGSAIERLRTDTALQESQARAQAVLQSTLDGIITIDEHGTIESFNPAAERLFGWRANEVIARNVRMLMPEPDRTNHDSYLARYRETGERRIIGAGREVQGLHRDGTQFPLDLSVAEVPLGNRRIFTATLRDLTERRRAEQAQRDENEVATALALAGGELLLALTHPTLLEGLCRLCDRLLSGDAAVVLARSPGEESFAEIGKWGARTEQAGDLGSIALSGEALTRLLASFGQGDVVEIAPDGNSPLRRPGRSGLCLALRRGREITGVLFASRPTDRGPFSPVEHRIADGFAKLASVALEHERLLRELDGANRIKSDFVATISHELRTPLHVVLGYTELLLEGELGGLTAPQRDALSRVDRQARTLAELVSQTLDLSRLERQALPVELREVTVEDLLREVVEETREQRQPGVAVDGTVGAGLPDLVTDPLKVKVVLRNVLGNALKFTDAGRVSIAAQAAEGGVEIVIEDTGIGIAPELLQTIFEPFRQLESSFTRKHGGAGLGLYVSRRFLDLLGGRIEVTSEVGRGSTFRIFLPATGP
jgi:PAS domain S-box-containing protein